MSFKTPLKHADTETPSEEFDKDSEFEVGDVVCINGTNRVGYCRFRGAVEFSSGVWAGIEFLRPEGTNDGSNQGVQYFKCKPLHGLFVRSKGVMKSTKHSPSKISHSPFLNKDVAFTALQLLTKSPSQSSASPTNSNSSSKSPTSARSSRAQLRSSPIKSHLNSNSPISQNSPSRSRLYSNNLDNNLNNPNDNLNETDLDSLISSNLFTEAVAKIVSRSHHRLENEIADLRTNQKEQAVALQKIIGGIDDLRSLEESEQKKALIEIKAVASAARAALMSTK